MQVFATPNGILIPVFGHLALVFFLFVMVTIKRREAVSKRIAQVNQFAHNGAEPELSRRWAKNLDNQFQVPLLFYALVAMLLATDGVNGAQILLAYIFLAGRMIHTFVQVSGDNVALRGAVFTINFIALAMMWLVFFSQRFALL